MAMLDDMVFQNFFGRRQTNSPIVNSLDDDTYSKLYTQYAKSLSWGSISTEKGFEEWLSKLAKKEAHNANKPR